MVPVIKRKQTWLIIFSLAGFIYCLLNILQPDSFLCPTTGCKIYGQLTLWGLSFYHYGAAYFILLAAACGYGHGKSSPGIIRAFEGLLYSGIIINCGLLVWQFLFIPCLSCLIVAVPLGLIFIIHTWNKQLLWKPAWVFCFFLASFSLLKVDMLAPKPIYGSAGAPIKLFVSPSCGACREMLGDVLKDRLLLDQTAVFPIAKNDQDISRLSALQDLLEKGVALEEALAAAENTKDRANSLSVEAMSWRNKSFLIRNGYAQVPVLLTTKSDIFKEEKADAWDVFRKDPFKGCGFEEEECD